jgi:hypothetical protein
MKWKKKECNLRRYSKLCCSAWSVWWTVRHKNIWVWSNQVLVHEATKCKQIHLLNLKKPPLSWTERTPEGKGKGETPIWSDSSICHPHWLSHFKRVVTAQGIGENWCNHFCLLKKHGAPPQLCDWHHNSGLTPFFLTLSCVCVCVCVFVWFWKHFSLNFFVITTWPLL